MDELTQELNAIQSAANISCDYQKTLVLLRALKAGTVSLDNVTMVAGGWTVATVETPAEPGEIVVDVVADEPPEEGE